MRSARKASTSAGVGGRPVRSNVTRADQRLARRLGRRLPALAPRARRARSGRSRCAASRACATAGTAGVRGGTNDQCGFHSAPCSIQRTSVAFSTSVERQLRVGRRHHHRRVGAEDAADQLALGRAARHDGAMARWQRGQRRSPACRGAGRPCVAVVRAVALEAAVREDRLDVEVEVDASGTPATAAPAGGTRPRRGPGSGTRHRRQRRPTGRRSGARIGARYGHYAPHPPPRSATICLLGSETSAGAWKEYLMVRLCWVAPLLLVAAGGCHGTPPRPFPGGVLVDLSHPYDAQAIFWPTAKPFRLDKVADGMTPGGYYSPPTTSSRPSTAAPTSMRRSVSRRGTRPSTSCRSIGCWGPPWSST